MTSVKHPFVKSQIIAGLVEVRQKILTACAALPAEKRERIFLGTWSVKDLLAHLAGWDYTNIQAARDVMAGQIPFFYAEQDHDWRRYNARLVEKHRQENFDDLLAAVAQSHQELIRFFQALPEDELNRDRGIRAKGWKVTIARLLLAETKDEEAHYQQILALAAQE